MISPPDGKPITGRLPDGAHVNGGRALRVAPPFAANLAFWHLAIALTGLPEFVLPRPGQVLAAYFSDSSMIWGHLLSTLRVAAIGFIFANLIERAFCRLKDRRRIATRYDKLAVNFASAVAIAATILWWA